MPGAAAKWAMWPDSWVQLVVVIGKAALSAVSRLAAVSATKRDAGISDTSAGAEITDLNDED